MALQLSVALRNARLDALERTSVVCRLLIYSGAAPANADAVATGTVLADILLPSSYMNSASGGVITKTGTWSDTVADATGTAGYFRIFESVSGIAILQGTVGVSATDMIVDSTSFTAGQSFTVVSFSITAANA